MGLRFRYGRGWCILRACESFESSLYDGSPIPSNPEHFQLLDGFGGPSYTLTHGP